MKRLFGVAGILAVILAAIGLYNMKVMVMRHAAAVRALERRQIEEEKAIRVLEAEWAYLSAPEELQRRAERYLGLGPMKDGQVVTSFDKLPFRNAPEGGDGEVRQASILASEAVSQPVNNGPASGGHAPSGNGIARPPSAPVPSLRATPRAPLQIEASLTSGTVAR